MRGAGRLTAPLLVILLTSGALASLAAWGASPYGRYLDHQVQPPSAAGQAGAIALFLLGWLLMSAAMMLPTTTGLVRAFGRVTRSRADAGRLLATLVIGFLAVWLAVGYAMRGLDIAVHWVVASAGWIQERPSLLAAATLATAGAFELSPLKHRCLTACRSPRSFVLRHWGGTRPRIDALRIGLDYGRSCAGCCWGLMLVMFALGTANLAWMLGLSAVMTAQKLAPAPRALSTATAVGLLLGAAVVLVAGT